MAGEQRFGAKAHRSLIEHGNSARPPLRESVRGRWTHLAPITPRDHDFLYALTTEEPNNIRWRYRGNVINRNTFEEQLWRGVLSQFLVATNKRRRRIGLVTAYQADLANGHAYVGGLMDPSLQGKGISQEAFGLFMRYLAQTWNLRKLYFEFPTFNEDQFQFSLHGMNEEGCFKDHMYYRGRFWDLKVFSIKIDDDPGLKRTN